VAQPLRGAAAQRRLTVDDFLAPAYPFELVAAKKADRLPGSPTIGYGRSFRTASNTGR
jgi:hypothetical protein